MTSIDPAMNSAMNTCSLSELSDSSGVSNGLKESEESRVDFRALIPFAIVGMGWLVVSTVVCAFFGPSGAPVWPSVRWMVMLWAFCLFDLYALARAVGAALSLVTESGEKRGALLIQASYWGMIKLACLGILGVMLFRGSSIPSTGLLMGTATMIVVPLVGGYWWSQKVLHHAS